MAMQSHFLDWFASPRSQCTIECGVLCKTCSWRKAWVPVRLKGSYWNAAKCILASLDWVVVRLLCDILGTGCNCIPRGPLLSLAKTLLPNFVFEFHDYNWECVCWNRPVRLRAWSECDCACSVLLALLLAFVRCKENLHLWDFSVRLTELSGAVGLRSCTHGRTCARRCAGCSRTVTRTKGSRRSEFHKYRVDESQSRSRWRLTMLRSTSALHCTWLSGQFSWNRTMRMLRTVLPVFCFGLGNACRSLLHLWMMGRLFTAQGIHVPCYLLATMCEWQWTRTVR